MRRAVKICGIRDVGALRACADYGADWVGFVFFAQSPRAITAQQAAELVRRVPDAPPRVGLFVKPTIEDIERVLEDVQLDRLQIYGDLQHAIDVQQYFSIPVWLSVAVEHKEELPTSSFIERYIIEPKAARDATRPGGNGRKGDWSLLTHWHPSFSWVLAGGLSPANVKEALHVTSAPGVDVSSGVETGMGQKDPRKIAQFIREVREFPL